MIFDSIDILFKYRAYNLLNSNGDKPLHIPTILIVEDDNATGEILSFVMEEEGYEVFRASTGNQAIRLAKSSFINLVLMDLKLPDMNGLQILENILKISPDTIGIIVTGFASLDTAIQSINTGAYSYVVKPISRDNLKLIVKKGLEKQQLSVENKNLHQKLKKNYLSTIAALTKTLEARDPYTKGHSELVAFMAEVIAKELKLAPKEIEGIIIAALFHDIGKIGISDTILQKKTGLTTEERKIIETHITVGAAIVEKIEFIKNVVPIIRYHHENFDGTGYLEGLSGKDIPIGARILSVCDAFSAMVSDRPYRKAKKMDHVVEELKKCSGSQFDPEIVKIILELIPTIEQEIVAVA